jgi:hypothetical protein
MKHVIHTITLCLIVQPVFHIAAMAEPGDPQPNPQELSAGLEKCWNWIESLSDFQPYLPANMPPPKQCVQLVRLTAHKCKLRGQRDPGGGRIALAQARLGDADGLMETFREFGIEPKDQGEYLAKLAFATKSEPKRVAELRGEPALFRSYCIALADEYEAAGQFDKAIETRLLLPRNNENEYWLIVPYAKAGQLDKAMEAISSLRDQGGNPYYPEQMMAFYLVEARKKDEARKVMTLYLADLRRLKLPDERLRQAWFAARLLKQIGDDRERRAFLADCELWDEEERSHEDIASKSSGAFSLARIAKETGDDEFARKSIVRAITLLRDAHPKDFLLRAHYASLQASLGMVAESKQTAKEALANAREESEEEKRDSNLSSVVEHFAYYRNEALLAEIDATLGKMRTLSWRALAMCGVVEFEIKYEQWERAKRHLSEGREYLRRPDLDRAEAFVHQFELDLLAAELGARQGEMDASRKLLQELLRRGYSPAAGDFTQKVFYEQRELGFLEDAWWTATWIPELDERFSALGSVMEASMEAKRANER